MKKPDIRFPPTPGLRQAIRRVARALDRLEAGAKDSVAIQRVVDEIIEEKKAKSAAKPARRRQSSSRYNRVYHRHNR